MAEIERVVSECLCSGCGACAGICNRNAISMVRNPAGFLLAQIAKDRCVNCSMCLRVCPSAQKQPLGVTKPSMRAVIGYATQDTIRLRGQSGGVVTAILTELIESGQVDGAVVTRMLSSDPETIYTEDINVVQECAGSVYAQTSVVEAVLRNKGKRMAVVALGCQTRALRLIQEKYPAMLPDLIIIGLICGGNMSLHLRDALIKKEHRKSTITDFRYRDKENTGWPGAPSYCADGYRVVRDNDDRLRLKPAYECYRCVVCPDKMNPMCDIVVGDPWGIEENNKDGSSVAIAYTEKGLSVLANAGEALNIRDIDARTILAGQKIETEYYNRLRQIGRKPTEFPHTYQSSVDAPIPMSSTLKERLSSDIKLYTSKNEEVAEKNRQRAVSHKTNMLFEIIHKIKTSIRGRLN